MYLELDTIRAKKLSSTEVFSFIIPGLLKIKPEATKNRILQ
jgi:hypothetical protein